MKQILSKKGKPLILGYKDDQPIIACEIRPDLGWGLRFYCAYCNTYHLHGDGDGSRFSHCTKESSPMYRKDYILKLVEGGKIE